MVPEQQMRPSGIARGAGQNVITRCPGPLLQPRPVQIGKGQDPAGNAAALQPCSRQRRLRRRILPQPVIDDQSQNVATALSRPALGQQRQRGAVSAAGYRHGQARHNRERAKPGHRRRESVRQGRHLVTSGREESGRFLKKAAQKLFLCWAMGVVGDKAHGPQKVAFPCSLSATSNAPGDARPRPVVPCHREAWGTGCSTTTVSHRPPRSDGSPPAIWRGPAGRPALPPPHG